MRSARSIVTELRALSNRAGDQPFLRIDGETYTYAEAWDRVSAVARGLLSLGVQPGDRVGIMADNRAETVWTWLGSNAARAIDVHFNSAARGSLLAYFVSDAEPRVLVGTADYLELLASTIETVPESAVCIGGGSARFGGQTQELDFSELLARGDRSAVDLPEPLPEETATIMYSSGTTGPSKGVMLPHGYYLANGQFLARGSGIRRGELTYNVQPLCHIDARVFLAMAVATQSTYALGKRFSVRNFWREVREHDADVFCTIGTMMLLLAKQEPEERDATQPARLAFCSSTPPDLLRGFEQRFGVQVVEAYGLTEAVLVTHTTAGATPPGRVGEPIDEYEVCLMDDHDAPVPAGELGELCFRPRQAYAAMQGYWRKPEETVAAWRNLWFHTGDFLRRHPDGQYEYVGRKKDAIRRRGENISAWEIERAVGAHPGVLEVAAIGVPSELGEEDVAVLIVRRAGADPAAQEIVEFAAKDLQTFAVPRYVEFVDTLPKTPSERIAKSEVRARGITPAAWDRERLVGAG
jgi:crotonobetaine/carnitine-CoA ligase